MCHLLDPEPARDSVKRDFPAALLVPLIPGALILDGVLSRLDGLLMLSLFLAWLVTAVIEARKQKNAIEAVACKKRGWRSALFWVIGLAFLIAAGNLIVTGARAMPLP